MCCGQGNFRVLVCSVQVVYGYFDHHQVTASTCRRVVSCLVFLRLRRLLSTTSLSLCHLLTPGYSPCVCVCVCVCVSMCLRLLLLLPFSTDHSDWVWKTWVRMGSRAPWLLSPFLPLPLLRPPRLLLRPQQRLQPTPRMLLSSTCIITPLLNSRHKN